MSQQKRQGLAAIVGANIQMFRESRGWKQAELAKKLNIGADSLSRVEHGFTAPRFERLARIADILGCHVAELFLQKGEKLHIAGQQGVPSGATPEAEAVVLAKRLVTLVQEQAARAG